MAENYGGFIPPPRGAAIYFIWFILFYESGEIMKRIFFGGCKIKIEWLIGISNETFLFQRMAVSATFVGSNPTRRMIFFLVVLLTWQRTALRISLLHIQCLKNIKERWQRNVSILGSLRLLCYEKKNILSL